MMMKLLLTSVVLCAGLTASAQITEITLPGERLYTESITSTKDGTLIVGSLGKGDVSKIAPGGTVPVEFLKPGANGLNAVFGVFADEKHGTLYVCSNKTDAGVGVAELKSFDLRTGAPKGSYALPGSGPFCNDIATAGDGTAYVADTRNATILVLKPGAKEFDVAAKDPVLAGADGLAFGDKKNLYVNSVTTGKLARLELGRDGKATRVVELKPSQALKGPDGMRAVGKNRLLLAENGGNMDIVTVDPKSMDAQITVIKSGLESTPAVTATRGMAWIAEGKLNYRGDANKDPGTFKMYAVTLSKK